MTRANDLVLALAPPVSDDAPTAARPQKRRGKAGAAPTISSAGAESPGAVATDDDAEPLPTAEAAPATGRASPAERRRAAIALIDVWRDLARDLALVGLGEHGWVHDPDLIEELVAATRTLPRGSFGRFLTRLDRAGQLLDVNANPELTLDVLALAWPRPALAA
jgi:hypothetical protein